MSVCSLALRLTVIHFLLLGIAVGQQDSKGKEVPDAPTPKPESTPHKRESPLHSTIGILGKRSVFFPDLAASPGPLRPIQKFELFADKSIAPSRLLSSGVGAGIRQADDALPGYGQGMEGYGKRLGSSMASSSATDFFGTFLLAGMLHDDPRYFVSLRPGFGHRLGYSLSRLVITRTDSGTHAANWPGIIGPLLAESLATSYLPEQEQTAGRTFRRYGIRIGFIAASNMVKEYWPTIFRSLRITKIAPGLQPEPPEAAPPPRDRKP